MQSSIPFVYVEQLFDYYYAELLTLIPTIPAPTLTALHLFGDLIEDLSEYALRVLDQNLILRLLERCYDWDTELWGLVQQFKSLLSSTVSTQLADLHIRFIRIRNQLIVHLDSNAEFLLAKSSLHIQF